MQTTHLAVRDFMSQWMAVVDELPASSAARFDLAGMIEACVALAGAEIIPDAELGAIEGAGSLLMDLNGPGLEQFAIELTVDAQFRATAERFAWAFDVLRQEELEPDDLAQAQVDALAAFIGAMAPRVSRRLGQIMDARRKRDRRRSHALMTEPDMVLDKQLQDPLELLEIREAAQAAGEELRSVLEPSRLSLFASSLTGPVSGVELAARHEVSPATVSRTKQTAHGILKRHAEGLLPRHFSHFVATLIKELL